MFRNDPGPCPICGADHTACTADSGPITTTLLPARDAAAAAQQQETPIEPPTFSTAEYSRAKHAVKKPR